MKIYNSFILLEQALEAKSSTQNSNSRVPLQLADSQPRTAGSPFGEDALWISHDTRHRRRCGQCWSNVRLSLHRYQADVPTASGFWYVSSFFHPHRKQKCLCMDSTIYTTIYSISWRECLWPTKNNTCFLTPHRRVHVLNPYGHKIFRSLRFFCEVGGYKHVWFTYIGRFIILLMFFSLPTCPFF